MIMVYFLSETKIQAAELSADNRNILENALWIDMISPSDQEEAIIEDFLNIDIPTKNEMEEIEPSSRLYIDDDVLFMTTTMIAFSDLPIPRNEVVTFILVNQKLITVRYAELNAFKVYINKLMRSKRKKYSASFLLLGLLDSITERLADILERISHAIDDISQLIFRQTFNANIDYKNILQNLGTNGDLGTKARESIVSLLRLISYLEQASEAKIVTGIYSNLKIIKNDIQAISDYAGFISTKVNFLLDATLGMINIEQNNIIKIFSIAAVIFLPPTLIASLYGMNFKHMPELEWFLGYPIAILLMVVSALLPLSYFKKKKWI